MIKRLTSVRLATLVVFVFVVFLFASVTAAAPARADESADAKAHYQKATAHYAVGEYHDAAVEYEEAYKAKQDPALLYNAAQSHRLANDNQKALLLYKNIVKLYPTSKYAD
jgi:outer membrane protein assembly factor BamD (BamD/ComL family)